MFNRFAKVLLSAAVIIGIGVNAAIAQTPPKEKKVKDQAEYDLYNNSIKTTDPAKRLTYLNEWKDKYPESDFKDVRLVNDEGLEIHVSTGPEIIRAAMEDEKTRVEIQTYTRSR